MKEMTAIYDPAARQAEVLLKNGGRSFSLTAKQIIELWHLMNDATAIDEPCKITVQEPEKNDKPAT